MKNIRNIIEQKYPPENPNDLWMKDDVLYKSTHKGWTPLTAGGGSSTNGVTSTTWLELKDKRDAGKLIPGALYRITDYNCTTIQENTRSAGHQFDIVLLALSENKLAEEGWAMMHDNIYDVTFGDGITKKCYFYPDDGNDSLIDCNSLLGLSNCENVVVNEDNKTITTDTDYDELEEPNVPYNYFQNSNLSAWKVWYCLDNDKSRFAWADDSIDETTEEHIIGYRPQGPSGPEAHLEYVRSTTNDTTVNNVNYYCWVYYAGHKVYTTSQTPEVGDTIYGNAGGTIYNYGQTVESYTPAHKGTGLPNGYGVIYRLIDEWNNDVAYDFKNIQYIRKLTDGKYYEQGTNTWCYTFNVFHDDVCDDATIVGNELKNDEDAVVGVFSNKIESEISGNSTSSLQFGLSSCIVFTCVTEDGYFGFNRNLFKFCSDLKLNADFVSSCIFLGCSSKLIVNDAEQSIYINNKKVLTES